MTLISALISKKGIAIATDSMLTAVNKDGSHVYLEGEKSKIVPIPKLNACISYWGFAGAQKEIPKDLKNPVWVWQTHSWLRAQSVNPKFSNLEDFTKNLCNNINKEIKNLGLGNQGIGLHIVGIEEVNGYKIPELFLISNFKDPSYRETGDLEYSRHTYHTIAGVDPSPDHRQKEYRQEVNRFLNEVGFIIYNNGDPIMFNPFANAFFKSFNEAQRRGVTKSIDAVEDTVPIVRLPIEIVRSIQRNFYKPDKKLVGGRVHDLSIADNGTMKSTSGDI